MMVICSFLFWSWGTKSLNEGETLNVGLFSNSEANTEYGEDGTITNGDYEVINPADKEKEETNGHVDHEETNQETTDEETNGHETDDTDHDGNKTTDPVEDNTPKDDPVDENTDTKDPNDETTDPTDD